MKSLSRKLKPFEFKALIPLGLPPKGGGTKVDPPCYGGERHYFTWPGVLFTPVWQNGVATGWTLEWVHLPNSNFASKPTLWTP